MKAHPERCRNTNILGMARTVALDKDKPMKGMTNMAIEKTIHRLIRNGLLIRNGNKRRADFIINYGHPMMPKEVEGDEVKTINDVKAKADKVIKANGGKTLGECIKEWIKNNPLKAKYTFPTEIANYMLEDGVSGTSDSIITILNKLARKGEVNRTEVGYRRFDYSVGKNSVQQEPEIEYGIKYEITPEEEAEVTAEAIDESLREIAKEEGPFFKDLVREGMDPIHADELTRKKKEEKHMDNESTSTTQSIKMPDGSTINLTININIGK